MPVMIATCFFSYSHFLVSWWHGLLHISLRFSLTVLYFKATFSVSFCSWTISSCSEQATVTKHSLNFEKKVKWFGNFNLLLSIRFISFSLKPYLSINLHCDVLLFVIILGVAGFWHSCFHEWGCCICATTQNYVTLLKVMPTLLNEKIFR